MEFKYKENELPHGQRLALERDCDSHQSSGIPCYCLIGIHEADVDKDIDAAAAILSEYRHNRQWRKPKNKITIREAIDKILEINKNRY